MDEVRRQRGETERHFSARKIFLQYLEIEKHKVKSSKINFEFPPYGGRARADLALIVEKPPVAVVKRWVEVQDTTLSKRDWKKKLTKIANEFQPEMIYVVVTENLSKDLLSLLDLVSDTLKRYQFFLVDTRKEKIYNFKLKNGIEIHEIHVSDDKIIKKKIEISLDRFLRG